MFLNGGLSTPHLLDLVAGARDALSDALVCPDGGGKFCIMLDNQLIQTPVARLKGLLQASLLCLPVLYIITAGQSPAFEKSYEVEEVGIHI